MLKKILIPALLFSFANSDFIRDHSKNIVLDTQTNIIWQDNDEVLTSTRKWADAITYCEDLDLAGYTNWHLPNINELLSIADFTKYDPAINDRFKQYNKYANNTNTHYYWSSTTSKYIDDTAFYLNAKTAAIYEYILNDKTNSYSTRCIVNLN